MDPRFMTESGIVRRGVRRLARVNTPVAGAEWKVTVPSGVQWVPLAANALITNSAAVGNRQYGFVITIDGAECYFNGNTAAQAAAAVNTLHYQQASSLLTAAAMNGRMLIPLVSYVMQPGDSMGSSTVALDVADQYSAVTVLIEEYYYTNQELSLEHQAHEDERQQVMRALSSVVGP